MDDVTRPNDPEGVARWLEDAGVSVVALPFVDSANIARTKTIPVSRFAEVAQTGVGLSVLFNVAMTNDEFALVDGYIDGPSGDLRLHPDPGATVPLAALPGWAWAPVDQYTQDGEPFPGCPRTFARTMTERLQERGLSVRATYELEFSMGRRDEDDEFQPAHSGPGYSDIALVANHDFAFELINAVEAQGLEPQQFHPEYAEGQFELSLAPRDPTAAADATMVARQTIRAIAKKHGWVTSFAPLVAADTGNGMHLHLSLWQGDRNLMSGGEGPYGMAHEGEAFITGILASLPAITAIAAPTCASYLRLQPHHWSGATRCWGLENREAALRFIAGSLPSTSGSANIEVKPVDGTANPYLTMGVLLAAGLDGIENDLRLPPPTEEDPASLAPEIVQGRGIERLPSSLSEAADRLAESEVLHAAMGDFLFQTFLATRRGEAERYGTMDDQELIRRTRWRF